MTLANKIAKNSLIQMVGKMVSLVLGLLTIAIMTRYLGQAGYGQYTIVISFLQFFGIIADFGLSLTTTQMISDGQANTGKVIRNILTLRLISSFLFLGLAPLIMLFLPFSNVIKIGVAVTSLSFYFITIMQVLTGIFQKELKMFEVTIAEVIGRLVLIMATAIGAMMGWSITWFFAAITLSNLINLGMVYHFAKKYIEFGLAFDYEIWREIWSRSWPIALSISFNLIYLKTDSIILSFVRPAADVGVYGAAYRVLDILTLLPAVYMGIVLPHLTRAFIDQDKKGIKDLMQSAFDSLMLFAVPVVAGTLLLSSKIMIFVAGPEFEMSGKILLVLILAAAAIFFTSLFGYAVVAINKQRKMMFGYLTAAILTLVGYLIFIPIYGYWAAAWLTVFSEILISIWTFIMVYRTIKFMPRLKFFGQAILSSVIMVSILYLVRGWNMLILLLIASVIYFGMMVLLGALKKETFVRMIKNVD